MNWAGNSSLNGQVKFTQCLLDVSCSLEERLQKDFLREPLKHLLTSIVIEKTDQYFRH